MMRSFCSAMRRSIGDSRLKAMWPGSKWDDPNAPDECKEENEHGGNVNDEGEPTLGVLINEHDHTRWADSDNADRKAGDDNGIADERGAVEQG